MSNGYFERGEVYWIGKVGVATLGVVVSSNSDNVKSEYIAVAAICGEEPHRGVVTESTGRTSWVACGNLRTVHKKELRSLVGSLSASEMRQVEDQLEGFFDLGYEDEDKEKELNRLRGEVAHYKKQVEYLNEGIMARSNEMNNWKKKYDAAVDRIVDLELDRDVAQRITERKTISELPVTEEPPVEEEVSPVGEEQEPVVEEKVDEPLVAPEKEPKEEFVRKPVNVNTASATEISEKLGVSMKIAYGITGYRNKNGSFVEVGELKEVSRVTNPVFERIKDYIVIEEKTEEKTEEPKMVEESEPEPEEAPKVEEQEVPVEKVNVNTASTRELMAVGFSKEVAARIVHSRKTCGPVNSIDELTRTDGVKSKDIRKLRDKLEV